MAQKIKIQDGNIVYVASDPSYDVNFGINGQLNVTKELNVGNDPLADGTISTPPGIDLNIVPDGNLSLQPTSGNILLNNVTWPLGTPNPGDIIISETLGNLNYRPLVLAIVGSDSLTTGQLNIAYPNALPGQTVAGPTVVYQCVGTGLWRILGPVTPMSTPETFVMGLDLPPLTTISFNGVEYSGPWDDTSFLPATFCHYDMLLNKIIFDIEGSYKISLNYYLSPDITGIPTGPSTYGSKIETSDVIDWLSSSSITINKIYNNSTPNSYTDIDFYHNQSDLITNTDEFMISLQAGQGFIPAIFAANFNSSTTLINYAGIRLSINKIGPTVASIPV